MALPSPQRRESARLRRLGQLLEVARVEEHQPECELARLSDAEGDARRVLDRDLDRPAVRAHVQRSTPKATACPSPDSPRASRAPPAAARRRGRAARARPPRWARSPPAAAGEQAEDSAHRIPATLAAALDLYEHQGKELFARSASPSPRARRVDARGGPAGGGGDRRPGRRQGAGADGRPRQGRRDQARRRPRGRGGEGAADPRARHPRPRRARLWVEQRVRDREGVLPLDHLRPRREAPLFMFTTKGGDRHRGGRGGRTRRARPAARRSARGLPALAGARARLRRGRRGPGRAEADRRDRREALRDLRRAPTRCSARSTRSSSRPTAR